MSSNNLSCFGGFLATFPQAKKKQIVTELRFAVNLDEFDES